MSHASTSSTYEFDVAVSFAGEDREFVEEIVTQIKAEGARVFYDSDFQTEMWGEDLAEYLDDVYRLKARYAVIFISSFYAAKMWAIHERRSALARALEDVNSYVLPVRLDQTNLPGLRPTIGYIDARKVGLAGIVRAILAKLAGTRPAENSRITRVPRTEIERQQLLLDRPPGWEYLYLAAQLLHEQNTVEDKYRDYRMRYAPFTGEILNGQEASHYMSKAVEEAKRLTENLTRVMTSDAQERALGAPGEAGDPYALAHLAKRWNSIYEGFLDWAAKVRGIDVPSEFYKAIELLASFNDSSIHAYRQFVDDLVAQTDRIPARIAAGEKVNINMTLRLSIPDEAVSAFSVELDRLGKA